jgi:hypothetical protein
MPARVAADDRIEQPARPDELADHYDLTIAGPTGGHADFDAWLADAAAVYGLRCARLTSAVAASAAARLAAGELSVGLHVACSTDWRPDDPFTRLAFAVQDAGGRPLNAPARAWAFTDRAAATHDLSRHGLGVPPTLVLRPWAEARPFSDEERWHLRLDEPGTRLEIVPAGRGAALRVERPGTDRVLAALQAARRARPGETFLVRPEVRPPWLTCDDGECRPAHWRVTYCLGESAAFWWQPADSLRAGETAYREVTPQEVIAHALRPIFGYVEALAEATGLEWFSADLALCPYPLPGRFTVADVDGLDLPVLLLDGPDDQCELAAQSRTPDGLPDAWVRRTARRLAELAWQVRRTLASDGLLLRAG